MSNCLAEAPCDRSEARDEEVPSWSAIVAAIRGSAAHGSGERARELADWADFVEGCARLRQRR